MKTRAAVVDARREVATAQSSGIHPVRLQQLPGTSFGTVYTIYREMRVHACVVAVVNFVNSFF